MKDFKKYYIVPADPEDVYKALTTETTIRLWTGDLVKIDPREGGEFSMWDDAIQGRFVTLEPYNKIVQQWYFGDQENPSLVRSEEHTSELQSRENLVCRLLLEKKKKNNMK